MKLSPKVLSTSLVLILSFILSGCPVKEPPPPETELEPVMEVPKQVEVEAAPALEVAPPVKVAPKQ